MGSERPDIFQFLDARAFLKAILAYLKTSEGLSVRAISKMAGFRSSSYLSMILKGERHLTKTTIGSLAEAINLKGAEVQFFERLVLFTQAKDPQAKDRFFRDLVSFRRFQDQKPLAAAEFEYFSHWQIVALFEALGTVWRKRTPAKMAKALGMSLKELRANLRVLESLNLIKKQGRHWLRVKDVVDSPTDTKSLSVRNFHREMIQKALESVDQTPSSERRLSSLTIPLSRKKFVEVHELLAECQKQINLLYSNEPEPDFVYQINVQVFPLIAINDRELNDESGAI